MNEEGQAPMFLILSMGLAHQSRHTHQGTRHPLGTPIALMNTRGPTDTLTVTTMTVVMKMVVEEVGMMSMNGVKEEVIIVMLMTGNDTKRSVI